MRALFWLLDTAISLYVWALIIAAVLSLLLACYIGALLWMHRLGAAPAPSRLIVARPEAVTG